MEKPVVFSPAFRELMDALLRAEALVPDVDIEALSEPELKACFLSLRQRLYSLQDFAEQLSARWLDQGGVTAQETLQTLNRDDQRFFQATLSGVVPPADDKED